MYETVYCVWRWYSIVSLVHVVVDALFCGMVVVVVVVLFVPSLSWCSSSSSSSSFVFVLELQFLFFVFVFSSIKCQKEKKCLSGACSLACFNHEMF